MKRIHFLIALLVLLPVSLTVRTWQLATAVDGVGFYVAPYDGLSMILGGVFLGLVAVLLVAARMGLRDANAVSVPNKNPVLGFAALLLAVSAVPQIFADVDTMGSGLMVLLPSLLLLVSFTVIAACYLSGRKIPFGMVVMPVVSEFIRLVVSYSHFNGISHISESVIYILFLCSFLGFLLAHARLYSGVDRAKGIKWAYGLGIAVVLFGCNAVIPHLLVGQNQHALSFVGLGAALYALAFLWVLTLQKPQGTQEETPDPAEPTESAQ